MNVGVDRSTSRTLMSLYLLGSFEVRAGDRNSNPALDLYRTLYQRTRWADDRRRYEELSGEALPDLPPLPAPPPIVRAAPVDLEALLAQVDQITAELAT